MWKNYFKIAIRNLLRNRVYTLINILGITLGISAAVVIYVILSNEANFDSFHTKAPNTYRIVQHNHTADGMQFWNTTAYPLADALRQDFPGLTVTQAAGPVSSVLSAESGSAIRRFEEDKVLFADEHYLSVFDFEDIFPGESFWIAGNPATAFAHPNSVVLTQSAAERYFTNDVSRQKEVVGKTLRINDNDILVITGVIKDLPPNTSLSFDVLIPFEYFKTKNEFQATNWSGNYQGTTFVVLPEHTNPIDFQDALTSVKKKHLSPEDNKRIEYVLQPLDEVHTNTLYGSSPGSYVVGKEVLIGLLSLALFIVIIACINYVNLATAQSLKRTREVGVRKVLGASAKQLFVQYMSEAFLITLLASIVSFFIAGLAIDFINRELSFVHFNLSFDRNFLLFGIVVLLSITVISGCYPSLALSKQPPAHVLKNRVAPSKRGFSIRQLLIVFQFSIAQLLIAATIIVASQMHFFRSKDLGYNKEAVLTVNIPDSDADKKEAFRQRLKQRPEIEYISFSSGAPTPYSRQYGTRFRLPYEPVEMMREAEMKMVDPEYMAVYGLKMAAGSWVTGANKTEGFNGLVVNEALARMLVEDPEELIGKQLTINEGEAPVIGVVKDFHNNGLQDAITPCVFLYWGPGFLDEASILLADHAIENTDLKMALNVIKTSWKEVYPEEIFAFEFLNESLEQHYRVENLIYKAFRIASGIAIFIGCLGLYGLVSFVVVQRTKEVGIRKLLGASLINILQLLSLDFIKLVYVAVLIATPLAWYFMHHWLQDFTYRISLEWWHFLGAGALTMGIALCTVGYQALRVAKANPVKNLRTE
jgi:putative ABC transport system permease protein